MTINKSFGILLAFTVLGASAMAQGIEPKKPSNLVVGFGMGPFSDTYFGLTLQQLEPRINDASYKGVDLSGFSTDEYGYAVFNSGIHFNLQLRWDQSGTRGFYQEWETGLGVVTGREILVHYYRGDDFNNQENITFCDMQNELMVYGQRRMGYSIIKGLNVYSGLGINAGTSFGNQFWVFKSLMTTTAQGNEEIQYNEEVYNSRNSYFARAYVPIGAEIVLFDKLHMGAEGRIGYGRQMIAGYHSFGGLNTALNLQLAWRL